LHRPDVSDQRAIEEAMDKSLDCWPLIAKGDMETAMLKLHTKAAVVKSAK
jgi:peptidyl-tRNA hydrolase, PTH1 family